MAYGQVDPATLEGDALMRWYRRTPQNIADERRRSAADAYNRFFYPARSDQSLGSDPAAQDDQDSSAGGVQGSISQDNGQASAWTGFGGALSVAPTMVGSSPFASTLGPGLLDDWTGDNSVSAGGVSQPFGSEDGTSVGPLSAPNDPIQQSSPPPWSAAREAAGLSLGPGLLGDLPPVQKAPQTGSSSGPNNSVPLISESSIHTGKWNSDDFQSAARINNALDQPGDVVFEANPETAAEGSLILVGGKMPKIRRQWSLKEGKDWPTVPETGRNFDGHHIIPKGNGGSDTVDNIEPMDPIAHRQHHMDNGDFRNWALRRWKGPSEPELPGLGLLQIIPDITGILSGRIRTDSLDNFFSDMMGLPSQEDIRRQQEYRQKQLFPNAKPGELWL